MKRLGVLILTIALAASVFAKGGGGHGGGHASAHVTAHATESAHATAATEAHPVSVSRTAAPSSPAVHWWGLPWYHASPPIAASEPEENW